MANFDANPDRRGNRKHRANEQWPKEKPFIFVNESAKTDPETRKIIRKYVMLGKNRGKTRKVKPPRRESRRESLSSSEDVDGFSGLVMNMGYSMIPNQIGNDLSFTKFAEPVEPSLVHDILKCKSIFANPVVHPGRQFNSITISLLYGKGNIVPFGALYQVSEDNQNRYSMV